MMWLWLGYDFAACRGDKRIFVGLCIFMMMAERDDGKKQDK
jgi:hypothetical protein